MRLTVEDVKTPGKKVNGQPKDAEIELVQAEDGTIQAMLVEYIEKLVPLKRPYTRRK